MSLVRAGHRKLAPPVIKEVHPEEFFRNVEGYAGRGRPTECWWYRSIDVDVAECCLVEGRVLDFLEVLAEAYAAYFRTSVEGTLADSKHCFGEDDVLRQA